MSDTRESSIPDEISPLSALEQLPPKKRTIEAFAKAFSAILLNFDKHHRKNPATTESIFLKQLGELKEKYEEYQSSSDQKNSIPFSDNALRAVEDIMDLYSSDEWKILDVTRWNPMLAMYLPEKALENTNLLQKIVHNQIRIFDYLDENHRNMVKKTISDEEKRRDIQYVDMDFFQKNPEAIRKLLGEWDDIRLLSSGWKETVPGFLKKDPKFLEMFDRTVQTLPQENLLQRMKNEPWYLPLSEKKLDELLWIESHADAKRKFEEMLGHTKVWRTEEIYETYDQATFSKEWLFDGEVFGVTGLRELILEKGHGKMIENLNKGPKGSIAELLKTNLTLQTMIQNSSLRHYISWKSLDVLFAALQRMETEALTDPKAALSNLPESVSKAEEEQFFSFVYVALCAIQDPRAESIGKIAWFESDVRKEKRALEDSRSSRGSIEFPVIRETFPNEEEAVIQKKNRMFSDMLANTALIDKDGKIVNSIALKGALAEIFSGSPLEGKINDWKTGGKYALQLIVEAQKKEIEQIRKNIGLSYTAYDERKFSSLSHDEKKLLLEKLEGPGLPEEKFKEIQKRGLVGNIEDPEERKTFLQAIADVLQKEEKTRIIASIATDSKKLALFESAWSGKITSEEMNAKMAERDREIETAKKRGSEERKNASEKVSPGSENVPVGEIARHFNQIPIGQPILTMIDGKRFTITKDSTDFVSVSSEKIEISGVRVQDLRAKEKERSPFSTLQFLRECGMDALGNGLQPILWAINLKLKANGKEEIDLSDGLSKREQTFLLQVIASLGNEQTEALSKDGSTIQQKFRTIAVRPKGVLWLFKAPLIKDGQPNIDAFVQNISYLDLDRILY